MNISDRNKQKVHDFWNDASCGETLYLYGSDEKKSFDNHETVRYELEPYILDFADFSHSKNKKVLEIGVGLGADHKKFAESGADLCGVDLTPRAIEYTKRRLQIYGLKSHLEVADAEKLPFEDNSFDIVYSWGVIHHSPDTAMAIKEINRVLKPGGIAKVMIYNKYSIVGLALWIRYALLAMRPFTSLTEIYSKYLESPGTKAYTKVECEDLFSQFSDVTITINLTHGDLLSSQAGQRHSGILLSTARIIWPRWFIRRYLSKYGLFMLVDAKKSAQT